MVISFFLIGNAVIVPWEFGGDGDFLLFILITSSVAPVVSTSNVNNFSVIFCLLILQFKFRLACLMLQLGKAKGVHLISDNSSSLSHKQVNYPGFAALVHFRSNSIKEWSCKSG